MKEETFIPIEQIKDNSKTSAKEEKICIDEIFDFKEGEKAQEFLVVDRKTGLTLNCYLDITNSMERVRPDIIQHYHWFLVKKAQSKRLSDNMAYIFFFREWLFII